VKTFEEFWRKWKCRFLFLLLHFANTSSFFGLMCMQHSHSLLHLHKSIIVTVYKYSLVPRANSRRQHCTTSVHYFSMLGITVNICFVISQNKCNKFVWSWSSNIECVLIRLVLRSDQKKCKCMVQRSLHHVPWNMTPCSPGTWRCIDETGDIVYFCTSCDTRWI